MLTPRVDGSRMMEDRVQGKSIFGRVVVFGVVLACVLSSGAFGQPWDGNGVEGDPYQIWTAEDMQAIGADYHYWRSHFRLMSDIDLGEYTGTNFNIIGRKIIASPTSIALDTSSGKMYWVDSGTDKIQRANLDGTEIEDMMTTGLGAPGDIALDVAGGKMYWTDSGNDKIQRANLDGSGIEGLVSSGLESPGGMALDVSGGKMYWVDGGISKIQRANLDGTGVEILITTGLDNPKRIALDTVEGKMYWTDSYWNGYEDIGGIRWANLDGSGVEDLVTTGLSYPYGIALDVAGGKMYWVDAGTDKVQRANLDGTEVEDVITRGLSGSYGIALDVAAGKMYWTDWDTKRIQRANLNGTEVEDLVASYFRGVFDGNGHTISNFTYADSNIVSEIGLFAGVFGPNAKIHDLRLVDPNISVGAGRHVGSLIGVLGGAVIRCRIEGGSVRGDWYVGGLVGEEGGGILECYSSTSVCGNEYVGGIAGSSGGVISNCQSSSTVTGTMDFVGGLSGKNFGTISDSSSAGITVNGDNYIGGLVGDNYETISNCYATGIVDGNEKVGGLVGTNTRFVPGSVRNSYSACTATGTYDEVGGLVGRNEGYISNCYSTGVISGEFYIGGLVGRNYDGEVLNCYATGRVTGYEPKHTGGLIGDAYEGSVHNSFWDVNTSGLDNSNGGIGKTTADMQTADTFVSWSCAGVWLIEEGNDYPHLIWENMPGQLLGDIQWYEAGNGTQSNPYLICTAEQLNWIGLVECDWAGYFKLGADIDLSDYGGDMFNIIGYIRGGSGGYKAFNGVFDGNGYTISNFTYNSTGKNYIGIFGLVGDPNAKIRNLGLTNPDVNDSSGGCVGSLVGYFAYGTMCECYVEGGSVLGNSTVGGLVGYSNSADILNCHSSVGVSGNGRIGGLAGSVWMGSFNNCYVAGEVNGISDTGALVGYDDTGSYSKCFWDVNVNPDVNGIGNWSDPNVIGETTANMQMESTFTDAGWDFAGEVINGANDIWEICEGTNYPKFVWQIPVGDLVCPDGVNFEDYAYFAERWYETDYGDVNGVELTGDGKINWEDFGLFAGWWMVSGCGGADFTGEGDVDYLDLDVLAGYWLESEYGDCGGAELTGDGIVDVADLREFTENWLAAI